MGGVDQVSGGLSHLSPGACIRHNAAHHLPRLCLDGHLNMITYQTPSPLKRGWLWVAVVGVAIGGAVWWWQGRSAQGPEAGSAQPAAQGIIRDLPATTALDSLPPASLSGSKPADFTDEEWSALKDAMARTDNPEQELVRVVDYLRFQRSFEQWQALQDSPDAATRRQLAQQLFDRVPARLKNGELSMGEAVLIQSALINDLESDDAARQQRLKEAQKVLAEAAPRPDESEQAREAALLAEYKRREAAIVADYQARPESQRNQSQLEEALESARRAVYSAQ